MRVRTLLVSALIVSSAGCGVIYTAPRVSEQPRFGFAYETGFDVRVVPLTYETAAAANLDPYVPARLPAAFQPDAARSISAGSASVPNLLPLPPRTARETPRPQDMTEHLPPLGTPELYRIGVGDVVLLAVSQQATSVEGLPGLIAAQSKRTGYTVQDDGAIAVPDAGRIEIAGKTVRDAEREIFRALVAAGIDPSFSLEVAEFHSQIVSVGGLVASPTLVPVTLKPLQLQAAIELAGGITADDPSVAEIQIFRDGTRYQIALARYLSDPDLRRMVLRDGDSIYVGSRYREAEAQRFFQEQLTLRGELLSVSELRRQRAEEAKSVLEEDRALFEQRLRHGAVEQPYAFVAGEVDKTIQVPLPFERTMSLANLLFNEAIGGIKIRTADYGAIYLLRPETDPQKAGGLTAYHLDAENAANLAAASMFRIHANDILFIAEQPVTSWNRAFSQILPDILSVYGVAGGSDAPAMVMPRDMDEPCAGEVSGHARMQQLHFGLSLATSGHRADALIESERFVSGMRKTISSAQSTRPWRRFAPVGWWPRLTGRLITILLALILFLPSPDILAQSESASSSTDSDRRERDKCRFVKVKRGESATLVRREDFTPSEGRKFPYLGSQIGLRPEFQVEDERAKDCAAYFGIPYAGSSGAVASGSTAVASAPAAAATTAAVAPVGLAPAALAPAAIAGGTVTLGTVAAGVLGAGVLFGAGAAVLSTSGSSGSTTGTITP